MMNSQRQEFDLYEKKFTSRREFFHNVKPFSGMVGCHFQIICVPKPYIDTTINTSPENQLLSSAGPKTQNFQHIGITRILSISVLTITTSLRSRTNIVCCMKLLYFFLVTWLMKYMCSLLSIPLPYAEK